MLDKGNRDLNVTVYYILNLHLDFFFLDETVSDFLNYIKNIINVTILEKYSTSLKGFKDTYSIFPTYLFYIIIFKYTSQKFSEKYHTLEPYFIFYYIS
jgi:hypothetical protein